MRSRNLGGKGVDPREKKTTENLSVVTADDIVMKTILPTFTIIYEQQRDYTAVDMEPHQAIPCHIPFTDIFDTRLPGITHFTVNEHESAKNMILQLKQDCPDMCSSKNSFMEKMSELFEICELGKPVYAK